MKNGDKHGNGVAVQEVVQAVGATLGAVADARGLECGPGVSHHGEPGQDRQNGEDDMGGAAGGRKRVHRSGQFIGAVDSRNRRISGLMTRNGRFYAVLWADRGDGRKTSRKFPLLDDAGAPLRTVTAAKEAVEKLRGDRRSDALPAAGRKPTFDAFAAEYLAMAKTLKKKPGTVQNETQSLVRWRAFLGPVRVDRIATPMLARFVEARLKGGRIGSQTFGPAHGRTVRLDLIALRNCLKASMDAGHLRDLPRFPKVEVPAPARRSLLTPEEFESLLAACVSKDKDGEPVTKNGEQLRDFLRFLAFTGAREQEALRVRWEHVDFKGGRVFIGAPEDFTAAAVTIGTGGESKNRGSRSVDFNPQLGALLAELRERSASAWLFPSPRRGESDRPARSLRESLRLARAKAKLPSVGFHDLRHLFCSFAVMAGIDFMTIAGWLGHKDGGILIGKVYGHLLDSHRRDMAARLTIGLAPVASAAAGGEA